MKKRLNIILIIAFIGLLVVGCSPRTEGTKNSNEKYGYMQQMGDQQLLLYQIKNIDEKGVLTGETILLFKESSGKVMVQRDLLVGIDRKTSYRLLSNLYPAGSFDVEILPDIINFYKDGEVDYEMKMVSKKEFEAAIDVLVKDGQLFDIYAEEGKGEIKTFEEASLGNL